MSNYKHYLLGLLVCGQAAAHDVKLIGTIDKTIKAPQNKSVSGKPVQQSIKLLKVSLSESAVEQIKNRFKRKDMHFFTKAASSSLPVTVQLGMNGVPVLNQGVHGTCVTFATTAAFDAAIGHGDYISQLCMLQLGLYFQKNGYNPSGWDGTWGRSLLGTVEAFGIVNKDNQMSEGCGGLYEYPTLSDQPGEETAMTPEQYRQLSEDVMQTHVSLSTPILDVYDAMLDRTDTDETIVKVKNALAENSRVTFGVLLLDFELGLMGAVGSHNATYDTWVLTPEIARDIYLRPFFGGHEMVITGYDDNAVAVDEKGRQHKGLFTIRNSWGEQFGDHGDFYMSYDYFKVLVLEANRIRNLNDIGAVKK